MVFSNQLIEQHECTISFYCVLNNIRRTRRYLLLWIMQSRCYTLEWCCALEIQLQFQRPVYELTLTDVLHQREQDTTQLDVALRKRVTLLSVNLMYVLVLHCVRIVRACSGTQVIERRNGRLMGWAIWFSNLIWTQ